ncbi:MAG: T9SS type A sorting domain-containing protein [Candidatus Cloacimonetes bacterium]|nr:T9SS type A sorting domain-containing protein [Candidatus Cloacimonadota bacterium]
MRRAIVLLVLCFAFMSLFAQWDPLNDYKMTVVQPPNPMGWDVNFTAPLTLGADWQCSRTGAVSDICIWHSWEADNIGTFQSISVSIYDDVPMPNPWGYSHPGNLLWNELFLPPNYGITGPDMGDQGWHDPFAPWTNRPDHMMYFGLILTPTAPFIQTVNNIYWLVVTVTVDGPELAGWKTTFEVFNDLGVWWDPNIPPTGFWNPVIIPPPWDEPVDFAFSISDYTDLLPVELSSFTASVTTANFVSLDWITQTESDMLGYNVLRAETPESSQALLASTLIPAQNQSTETAYNFIDIDVEQEHTYWYWLEAIELTGESTLHGPVSVMLTGGEPEDEETPDVVWVTALEANFPNPFNPSTSIVYTLAEASAVDLAVYNSRGALVRLLHDVKPQGRHSIVWDGMDTSGATCASGVYYFHLQAGGVTDVSKGILIK